MIARERKYKLTIDRQQRQIDDQAQQIEMLTAEGERLRRELATARDEGRLRWLPSLGRDSRVK